MHKSCISMFFSGVFLSVNILLFFVHFKVSVNAFEHFVMHLSYLFLNWNLLFNVVFALLKSIADWKLSDCFCRDVSIVVMSQYDWACPYLALVYIEVPHGYAQVYFILTVQAQTTRSWPRPMFCCWLMTCERLTPNVLHVGLRELYKP